MALSLETVEAIVAAHDERCEQLRPEWEQISATYSNRFWNVSHNVALLSDAKSWLRVQRDLLGPWVRSLLAQLFYKDLEVKVEQPAVGGKRLTQDEVDAVGLTVSTFFTRADMSSIGNTAFQFALMHSGGGAVALWRECADDYAERLPVVRGARRVDALSLIRAEAVAPWDAVYDRTIASAAALPYIGRIRYLQDAQLDWKPDEEGADPAKVRASYAGERKYDALRESDVDTATRQSTVESDRKAALPGAWFRVLELYDMMDPFLFGDLDAEDQSEFLDRLPEADRRRVTAGSVISTGSYKRYVLPAYKVGYTSSSQGSRLIERCPIPFTTPDGVALAPIRPIVLDSLPERPLENVAPARAIFEVARETNVFSSISETHTAIRSAQVVMVRKDGVDAVLKTALESGAPMSVVEIEGAYVKDAAVPVTLPPLPDGLYRTQERLDKNAAEVAGVTAMMRGQGLQYASATEADALRQYAETTVGTMRRSVDRGIGDIAATIVRILYFVMFEEGTEPADEDDAVKTTIRPLDVYLPSLGGEEPKPVRVKKHMLDQHLRFRLADGSTSAYAQNEMKTSWPGVVKLVSDLATFASQAREAGNDGMAELCERLLNATVGVFKLPEELRTAGLKLGAPPPPPPPPPPPGPPPAAPLPPPDPETQGPVLDAMAAASSGGAV